MFTVSSGFIGNFKLGDNINHTLRGMAVLYQTQRIASEQSEALLLCKPIIVFIGSICEAVLYDLHDRMRLFTVEGVKNIGRDVLAHVRGIHIDEFSKYIASVRKHDLLKDAVSGIYISLDDLRKMRNRIHIQNKKGHFEPDDGNAFTMARQIEAEKTLERVIKVMANKYDRHPSKHCVADFQLPWNEHFTPP